MLTGQLVRELSSAPLHSTLPSHHDFAIKSSKNGNETKPADSSDSWLWLSLSHSLICAARGTPHNQLNQPWSKHQTSIRIYQPSKQCKHQHNRHNRHEESSSSGSWAEDSTAVPWCWSPSGWFQLQRCCRAAPMASACRWDAQGRHHHSSWRSAGQRSRYLISDVRHFKVRLYWSWLIIDLPFASFCQCQGFKVMSLTTAWSQTLSQEIMQEWGR